MIRRNPSLLFNSFMRKGFFSQRRDFLILPHYLNKTFCVYNGKEYVSFVIKDTMIGHRLGEFVTTKKLGSSIHSSARNKKKAAQRRTGKKK